MELAPPSTLNAEKTARFEIKEGEVGSVVFGFDLSNTAGKKQNNTGEFTSFARGPNRIALAEVKGDKRYHSYVYVPGAEGELRQGIDNAQVLEVDGNIVRMTVFLGRNKRNPAHIDAIQAIYKVGKSNTSINEMVLEIISNQYLEIPRQTFFLNRRGCVLETIQNIGKPYRRPFKKSVIRHNKEYSSYRVFPLSKDFSIPRTSNMGKRQPIELRVQFPEKIELKDSCGNSYLFGTNLLQYAFLNKTVMEGFEILRCIKNGQNKFSKVTLNI